MASPIQTPPAIESRRVALAGLLLTIAIIAAYFTSFRGVFVLDDLKGIVENPTIQDWRRLDLIFNPGAAGGGTVGGRPLVNFSLALNFAAGGTNPWGYHAVNLAIHVGAALLLFGLVRQTLALLVSRSRPAGDGRIRSPASRLLPLDPTTVAITIAALWALHPLQTESVTYVIQRAESLCGVFYLATLYCFTRSVVSPVGGISYPDSAGANESGCEIPPPKITARGWLVGSFLFCLAGMATKEVMVTAPVAVFLFDRTFVAGSFGAAWRQRGRFYLALMATWLLLGWLVLRTGNRGGTAGFGTGIAAWPYAVTQAHAIMHYLRLALWPQPLVLDYGTPLYPLSAVWGEVLAVLILLAATGWALVRRATWGFFGALFFILLAPSSSVVPVATQTMAEHRMYLALAPGVAALVIGAHRWLGRRATLGFVAIALLAGTLSARRNLTYMSEFSLWEDTVTHAPTNHRARTNFGIALTLAGRLADAEAQFREALRLEPTDAAIPLNLCSVIGQQGRLDEAASFGETAVKLDPLCVPAHVNLAYTLEQLGKTTAAIPHYEEALRLDPATPNVAVRLGALLFTQGNQAATSGDFPAAIAHYRRILAFAPEHLPARANLGNALLVSGRVAEAITEYRAVLARNPTDARVQQNLARALEMLTAFPR